ncbi:hypothetical protein [Nocardiopsis sp. MG754419]|uniref:hypothetical protein n=1 Tax=Nocardiopsis sp. MG754419 TaxID=2259865 RepID=UPI001BA9FE46|nr:hypothetical protein [Nocardiopsis sp. MG754419]MBR8744382.1 hypothetical protein [Nocardiopsis sp. MG754419]
MRSNDQDGPSETERLRLRVVRLEMRLATLAGDAPSDRTTSAALTGGTVALFLSPALPWVREGGGFRVFRDGTLGALEPTGYATGWDVLWGALEGEHVLLLATLGALLSQIGFAVGCHFKQDGFRLATLMALCALVPALFFVSWLWSGVPADGAPGAGVFVMLVASAVLAWASYRSWHQDHVVGRSPGRR